MKAQTAAKREYVEAKSQAEAIRNLGKEVAMMEDQRLAIELRGHHSQENLTHTIHSMDSSSVSGRIHDLLEQQQRLHETMKDLTHKIAAKQEEENSAMGEVSVQAESMQHRLHSLSDEGHEVLEGFNQRRLETVRGLQELVDTSFSQETKRKRKMSKELKVVTRLQGKQQ
eukprot:1837933-Amphidinium_carterae.1